MAAQAAHCTAAAGARTAQQDCVGVGGNAPLLSGGVEGLAAARPRPLEVAVEDVAARHGEVVLDVLGHLRLDAGVAVWTGEDAVHQRLREVYVDRGDRASYGLITLAGPVAREQCLRHVQAEVGERVHTLTGQVAQDRGVGERVAVELSRWVSRDRAAGGLPVGTLESGVLLGHVERAGERILGVVTTLQPGQSGQQEVDLELRPGGLAVAGLGVAEQDAQHPRRHVGQHVPRLHGVFPASVVPGDLGAVRACTDAADTGASDDLGTSLGGAPQHRRGDRAHAADRHPPLTGAVADQVVEEAPVLDERGVAEIRERADKRVGRHDAPDEIVAEPLLDHLAQRSLHDRLPQHRIDLLTQ